MKIRSRRQPANFDGAVGEAAAQPASREPAPVLDLSRDEALEAPQPQWAQPAGPLQPNPPRAELAAASPQTPVRRPEMRRPSASKPDPQAWPIWLAAVVVSVLWAGAPIAFALGYRGDVVPFRNDIFALTVFASLAIGPAGLVWLVAYLAQQGRRLAAETERARSLADEMVSPAIAAAARAGDAAQTVREEIARAGEAADQARETLLALRQALAAESERLIEAAAASSRTAQGLAQTLGRERTELNALSHTLDSQSAKVADAITQQARMVAEASDLAETQLREAEASLAARAADLAAAAGEASDAARTASEDLTRHIARLETAGAGVAEQVGAIDEGLTEQRAALVTVAHTLRADQEAFAAQAETHSARLSEYISQARLSSVEMGDRAVKSADQLRTLVADAAERFRDVAETAKAEREELNASTLNALETVAAAAAEERARLEAETRAAVDALAAAAGEAQALAARHAEAARQQVDQLSEAAFSAGLQANQAFDARLEEARGLIESSAKLVEEAGANATRKLEAGVQSATAALAELRRMMGDLEERAGAIPAVARSQAEEVRAAVAESMDELLSQARQAAEETQAIDTAFQDRVRRNYEMLSDAVRLMGNVATSTSAPTEPSPAPRRLPPSRSAAKRSTRTAAEPPPPQAEAAPAEEADLELDQPVPPPRPSASDARARLRLRLTPTSTDEEFSTIFEAATGERGEDAEGWTWKDLLSSLDETGGSEQAIEATLTAEIAAMGIDPAALLPKGRIEEIAAVLQTGDAAGAREVVRKLAPAATRRLTRRLFTDPTLKRQVGLYLERYERLVKEAAQDDPEGFAVANLLGAQSGRTYLLFDAAGGGDLG